MWFDTDEEYYDVR